MPRSHISLAPLKAADTPCQPPQGSFARESPAGWVPGARSKVKMALMFLLSSLCPSQTMFSSERRPMTLPHMSFHRLGDAEI